MITIKGKTLKDIYHMIDKKYTNLKGIEQKSNGYTITLPADAKGKILLIKFEDENDR